jgi:hypothetical protein
MFAYGGKASRYRWGLQPERLMIFVFDPRDKKGGDPSVVQLIQMQHWHGSACRLGLQILERTTKKCSENLRLRSESTA